MKAVMNPRWRRREGKKEGLGGKRWERWWKERRNRQNDKKAKEGRQEGKGSEK